MSNQLVSSTLFLTFLAVFVTAERELVPLEAPTNLTLLEIKSRQVVVEWDAVNPSSVRGSFRGYLVRTWNHAGSQVYAFPPEITRVSVEFFPFSKNFITVSVKNEKYVGPPSAAISFDAPQIEPSLPHFLNVFPLSNKSVLLQWTKPTAPNGILLGYKIYCKGINDSIPDEKFNEIYQISHQINDPDKFQAKLTGLQEGVKYRIEVSAVNCAGESERKFQEIVLDSYTPAEPSIPKLHYKINYRGSSKEEQCHHLPPPTIFEEENVSSVSDDEKPQEFDYYDFIFMKNTTKQSKQHKTMIAINHPEEQDSKCLVDCMILWVPNLLGGTPGEHFYVKYRVKGEQEFRVTEPEMIEDFVMLPKFNSCKNHEIVLVAVDGPFSTESKPELTPTTI